MSENVKPSSGGVWWYEHIDYPVVVKPIEAFGDRLCVFIREWKPVEDVRPGWWLGPLVKPNGPECREQNLLAFINVTPPLLSLLYDMDWMSEQLERGSRDWFRMLMLAEAWQTNMTTPACCAHMRFALENAYVRKINGLHFGSDVIPAPLTDPIVACPWCGKPITPQLQSTKENTQQKE